MKWEIKYHDEKLQLMYWRCRRGFWLDTFIAPIAWWSLALI
jgi:hypothetical protein